MENTEEKKPRERVFPATVVRVINNNTRIVINKGEIHGVRKGQKVLVYSLGGEVKDPNNGESLGYLEIVKGTGEVIHVQEKMSTIQSDQKKSGSKILKRTSIYGLGGEEIVEPQNDLVPFEEPEVGDMVKPI